MLVPSPIRADLVGPATGSTPSSYPPTNATPPAGDPNNPYQAPYFGPGLYHPYSADAVREYARSKVAGPAIALMCLSILIILLVLLRIGLKASRPGGLMQEEVIEFNDQQFVVKGEHVLLGNAISSTLNLLVFFGALGMKQLRGYGLAMTASIVVMIPCATSCFCIAGLPFGIWSIVVLSDSYVKASFQ